MKTKNIAELLSISATLYMFSRDEEFVEKLSTMAKKGKEKIKDFIDEYNETEVDGEKDFAHHLYKKAKKAEQELKEKLEELIKTTYEKMNIAHTDELNSLKKEIELLHSKISSMEAKLSS